LNINKLGCIGSRYLFDCYGTFTGGINAGMPTDRFLVEWWIRGRRVQECLDGRPRPSLPAGAEPVDEVVAHPSGLPVPVRCDLDRGAPALLVEVPTDIQAIKRADLGLACAWLEHFREIFPAYFARGYRVCGFVPWTAADRPRCLYVLQRAGEDGAGGEAGVAGP
jgi:predicted GNAT superfamily acetyltransferase